MARCRLQKAPSIVPEAGRSIREDHDGDWKPIAQIRGQDLERPALGVVLTTAHLGRRAMAGKTVTRADLCEAVYRKVGLSRAESATLVELTLQEITDSLERGATVKLSSFGSFVVRKKGQRIGRNPKTGKEVPVSPRRVMVFKPSAILKTRINAGRK